MECCTEDSTDIVLPLGIATFIKFLIHIDFLSKATFCRKQSYICCRLITFLNVTTEEAEQLLTNSGSKRALPVPYNSWMQPVITDEMSQQGKSTKFIQTNQPRQVQKNHLKSTKWKLNEVLQINLHEVSLHKYFKRVSTLQEFPQANCRKHERNQLNSLIKFYHNGMLMANLD